MGNSTTSTLDAWAVAYAAARAIGTFDAEYPRWFALSGSGGLCPVAGDDPAAVLAWNPLSGWETVLHDDDANRDLLELYLPISSATVARPITIGHLGQSLDGFIATHSGDAISVTGPENILHLHRLRALCDAVVVGAATVAADNPRLTTRLVAGSNPVRVILDPGCRLPLDHTVFNDREALTLRACVAGSAAAAEARARDEDTLEVAACEGALDLADLLRQLRARGYTRIFVEGGGVTVSSFLNAGLLDRLHIAIAPLLIGEGRPAIRMPPQLRLQDCLRLQHRVYRSGSDILFDCDLRAVANGHPAGHGVRRVL
jgi:diaminohydroxyphosphoribosylaminopyrimidine deaminase/5-amino-6-(5-phosphoribosylamino)uracil reductase